MRILPFTSDTPEGVTEGYSILLKCKLKEVLLVPILVKIPIKFILILIIVSNNFLLLVAIPGAPSSVLVPSSDALCYASSKRCFWQDCVPP